MSDILPKRVAGHEKAAIRVSPLAVQVAQLAAFAVYALVGDSRRGARLRAGGGAARRARPKRAAKLKAMTSVNATDLNAVATDQ
jgi:hypothetical protein